MLQLGLHVKRGLDWFYLGLNVLFLGLGYGPKAVNTLFFHSFRMVIISISASFCYPFEPFMDTKVLFWLWVLYWLAF